MSRCARCFAKGAANSWGALTVCSTCYDDLNPIVKRYPALSENQISKLALKRCELMAEVQEIDRKIKLGKEAKDKNTPYLEVRLLRPSK